MLLSAETYNTYQCVDNSVYYNHLMIVLINTHPRGGGGVLDISLGGEVRRGPSYPDPVKTNIADFPTLFKTEFRFLIPCLRHLINIKSCKNFAVYRPRKDILFKTIIDKSIP